MNNEFDTSLSSFIEAETQNHRFRQLVHSLTDTCWDLCMEKPGTRLEGKTETCLNNCVGRFLDVSQVVLNRLGKLSGQQSISSFEVE